MFFQLKMCFKGQFEDKNLHLNIFYSSFVFVFFILVLMIWNHVMFQVGSRPHQYIFHSSSHLLRYVCVCVSEKKNYLISLKIFL